MTPERKLKYLKHYMNRWIEHYPSYKFCSFEVFVRIEEKNRKEKETAKHKANLEAKPQTAELSVCQYCERSFRWHQIKKTRDHIVPLSKGGKNGKNVIRACFDCNQWKGSKDLSEWLAEIMEGLIGRKAIYPKGYSRRFIENILVNIRKIQQQIHEKSAA